jgi:hypothetical protein
MVVAFSIGISLLALALSFFVFVDNRRKDQRDTFLRLHQVFNDDEIQRGRHLLFNKATDQDSIEKLTESEWRDITRVIANFNTLGFYLAKHYVSESDVLELWARPIIRTWTAAQPFMTYRQDLQGYRSWRYFDLLARKAQEYRSNKAGNFEVKIWRRPDTAVPIPAPLTHHESDGQGL